MGTQLLRRRVPDEVAAPVAKSDDGTGSDDMGVRAVGPAAIPSTRASRTWTRLLPVLVLFAAILLFVLQNLRSSKVRFMSLSGTLPLGVALLAAVALGALLVLTLGSVRILQLRQLVRRNHRAAQAGGRA